MESLANPAFGIPPKSRLNCFGLVCCEHNHIHQVSNSWDESNELENIIKSSQVLKVDVWDDDLREGKDGMVKVLVCVVFWLI